SDPPTENAIDNVGLSLQAAAPAATSGPHGIGAIAVEERSCRCAFTTIPTQRGSGIFAAISSAVPRGARRACALVSIPLAGAWHRMVRGLARRQASTSTCFAISAQIEACPGRTVRYARFEEPAWARAAVTVMVGSGDGLG